MPYDFVMDSEPKQMSLKWLLEKLFLPLVIGLAIVIAGHEFSMGTQNKIAAKSESDTMAAQRTEIYRLVNKMSGELNLRDYKAFRTDALLFRQVIDDHRYDRALGIDFQFSDLRLLFTNALNDINLYLYSCPANELAGGEHSDGCTDNAKPYISVALNTLELALQTRNETR